MNPIAKITAIGWGNEIRPQNVAVNKGKGDFL